MVEFNKTRFEAFAEELEAISAQYDVSGFKEHLRVFVLFLIKIGKLKNQSAIAAFYQILVSACQLSAEGGMMRGYVSRQTAENPIFDDGSIDINNDRPEEMRYSSDVPPVIPMIKDGINPGWISSQLPKSGSLIKVVSGAVPNAIWPLLAQDSKGKNGDEIIQALSVDPEKFAQNFIENPTKETLEALVYAIITELHDDHYPEVNMPYFRKRVRREPDCARISSELKMTINSQGGRAVSTKFYAGGSDPGHQFVTFLKVKGQYFGVDQAAWYYGDHENPWFYVMEGSSVDDIFNKMLKYFHTQTQESDDFDREKWEAQGGNDKVKASLVERLDQDIE